MHAQAYGPLPLVSTLAPNVGSDLEQAVAQALERSSLLRQNSAFEVMQQIAAVKGYDQLREDGDEEEEEGEEGDLWCLI